MGFCCRVCLNVISFRRFIFKKGVKMENLKDKKKNIKNLKDRQISNLWTIKDSNDVLLYIFGIFVIFMVVGFVDKTSNFSVKISEKILSLIK